MRPPLIPQTIPIHDQDSKLVKLLKTLFNSLVEYREKPTGRIVVSLFMCLPSRKDFPEYFNIIAKPISMYEIRKRIETNYYTSEEQCLNDFKLMFNNCRTFNEDGSIIFEDSRKLEKIVLDKYNELKPSLNSNGSKITISISKSTINNDVGGPVSHPAKPDNHNHVNNRNHQTNNVEKNNLPTNVNSNLISQSSNGFPSEDSNSNSNNFSASVLNEDSLSEIPFQNDVSMDSNTSIQERPTKRSKRDHDLPKKRVLTGYIIYAAEVRKEYVDKNPSQDFGYISRLIGNDWKNLPRDLKLKYEQRAIAQNAQMARENLRLEQIRASTPTTSSATTPATTNKKHKGSHNSTTSKPALNNAYQVPPSSSYVQPTYVETATQTATPRFVVPPRRINHNYAQIYRRYLGEELEITPTDVYAPETDIKRNGATWYNDHYYLHNSHHLEASAAERWLGSGIGRHKSSADALWALRDFMLQDVETMRWNLQPYQMALDDETQ